MKILLTRHGRVSQLDGVSTFIFELSEALLRLGHDVQILASEGSNQPELIKHMFDMTLVPEIHILHGYHFDKLVIEWAMKGTAWTRRLNPDMIIMNGVVPIFSSAFTVTVNHGLKTNGSFPVSQRMYDMLMYRHVDQIVVVSPSLLSQLQTELGIRETNMKAIPVGLDTEKYEERRLSERASCLACWDKERQKPLMHHTGC